MGVNLPKLQVNVRIKYIKRENVVEAQTQLTL